MYDTYVLNWSEDGAAEAVAHEGGLVEAVKDHFLLLLVDLLHLAEDDVALALNGGVVELGVLQDVREDVDRARHVLLEHLGVVHGLLARRVGVQMAAHVLDLELELLLRALGRALEGHVLQKVGRAVVLRGLVARAGADPHADRGGLAVRTLRRHAQAVGERGDLGGRRVEHVRRVVEARGRGGLRAREQALGLERGGAEHLGQHAACC